MVRGWYKRVLDWLGAPELDWVQVEVSTRCGGRCVYCPRSGPGRDMDVGLFRSLLASLGQTRHVHLQGWGEPLLHPGFFELAALCRGKGKEVSTTSNGNELDAERARRLVAADVGVLGVSLAGVRAEVNDAIRLGTGLERVRRGLEILAGEKARQGRERPVVHLAYLNVGGVGDLGLLPELAGSMGVSKIMVNEPSPLMTPESAGLGVVGTVAEREAAYGELAERAGALGIEVFWARRLLRESGLVCTENPGGACVVGVDGHVSPCVLGLPVSGEGSLVFGDVRRESLTDIWHKESYAAFRALFDPQSPSAVLPEPCASCHLRAASAPSAP